MSADQFNNIDLVQNFVIRFEILMEVGWCILNWCNMRLAHPLYIQKKGERSIFEDLAAAFNGSKLNLYNLPFFILIKVLKPHVKFQVVKF